MKNCNRLSYQFQKFIFGVVLEQLRHPDIVLKFDNPRFKFRPCAITKESTRNLLKYLDFDYKRDEEGKPVSYRNMDNKEMVRHIQWIELKCSQSGFTLEYINDEWEKILKEIKCR